MFKPSTKGILKKVNTSDLWLKRKKYFVNRFAFTHALFKLLPEPTARICIYMCVYVDQIDALSFLIDKRAYKRFKTKCEEQKREAKAAYEARCEPSLHIKLTDNNAAKRRYCPDLKLWSTFVNYEIH